jgi:hypothetical protein
LDVRAPKTLLATTRLIGDTDFNILVAARFGGFRDVEGTGFANLSQVSEDGSTKIDWEGFAPQFRYPRLRPLPRKDLTVFFLETSSSGLMGRTPMEILASNL